MMMVDERDEDLAEGCVAGGAFNSGKGNIWDSCASSFGWRATERLQPMKVSSLDHCCN